MARILVIEDNEINLELMTYLLRAWGHEVLIAENGASGLAMTRSERPDLVICDIQMPDTDGYTVARTLRSDPATAQLRLVAVTAFAMVGDRDKALQAGFDAHFPKPIEPAEFMAAITPLLPTPGRPPQPSPAGSAWVGDRVQVSDELRAPAPGIVVLMVDDTESNLQFKVTLLESAGYVALSADSGQAALRVLAIQRVDLILSDAVMASGSGFDLLAAVRSTPAWSAIPFIFLTGTARDSDSRTQGMALGADDYLLRPIEPQNLLAAIRACLTR